MRWKREDGRMRKDYFGEASGVEVGQVSHRRGPKKDIFVRVAA